MIVDKLINSIFQSAICGELFNDFKSLPTLDENKPFSIPETWEWKKFKDFGEFVRGKGIKKDETSQDGIQCVRYGEIYTSYKYKFEHSFSFVPENVAVNCNQAKQNDILFTLTGESEYEIAKSVAYLGDEKLVIGGDMALFTNHNQNPMYLSYFMYSPYAINYKAKNCTGKMIIHTSIAKIQELYVPLPPIEEQNKIVEKIELILNKLNEVKELESNIITLKKEFSDKLKSSLLKSTFDGILIASNIDQWDESELNDIADICTGNSISETDKKTKYNKNVEGYNFIATKDLLFDHTFNYETNIIIPKTETKFKVAKANDILMCIEGGSAGKKIGILEEDICFGNKLCKFSSSKIYHKYLYYYLQSPQFKSVFYDSLTGLIGGVSINKIRKVTIKYPSYDEQVKIIEKLEQILYLCDNIEKLVNE